VVVLSVLPICLGVDLPPQLTTLTIAQPDSDVDLTLNIVTDGTISVPNVKASVNGKNDNSALIVNDYGSDVSATISIDRSAIGGSSSTTGSSSSTTSGGTTSGSTTSGSTSGTTKSHSNSDSGNSDSAASSFGLSYLCVLLSVVGFFFTSRKGAAIFCVIAFIALLSMPSHADSLASTKVVITLNLPAGWSVNGIASLPSKLSIILETVLTFGGVYPVVSHPRHTPSPSCIPVLPDPGTCDHDVCTFGATLLANCSTCATALCAADSFCCDPSMMWDDTCVNLVATSCAGFSCCV